MKKITAMLLVFVLLAGMLAGCNEQPLDPSSNPSVSVTPSDPTVPADPWADYECITIAEALALCENFVDSPSTERYYIRATIVSVDNPTYGQMTIRDETGEIMVYGSYNADGTVRYDAMTEKPEAGDEILIHGTLQNYKGNTKEVQNARIIDFIVDDTPVVTPELPADGSELTIAELLALPLSDGEVTEQFYLVHATVESVTNATYGAMIISDETGSISVYNSKAEDGTYYTDMADKPYKGDSVVLKCNVKNFKGSFEINQAYIVSFTHADITIDPSEYTSMSIADARNAQTGTKVQVSGVVAYITYANGFIPSGVILVDGTSSIYVYDGDLAGRCAIGNTISVYASKTYWILDSEQSNAAKFGYLGCCQLESAVLISNDGGKSDFDKSWIEASTVKDIIDTPVTEDISTKIFKVTAQIKKAEGSGFVNYYINDLDGVTGSYSYSQCNGGDFAWLDAYDGKICTVYLMALNAKSTTSDCFWRFLPIAVVDEGFDPSTVNGAEHIVKYYGVGQFLPTYTGNPALELLQSVDSPLVGITGAQLTYSSSDSSVISIDNGVMNCLKTGTATVTVSCTYGGSTYSQDVTIEVRIVDQNTEYPTVSDAINAADGEHITVQGIVGPSLVNQSGFYLIDQTGIIAVLTDEATLATLEYGQQVVLEGDRFVKTKGGSDYFGQSCIQNAVVVTNNYGSYDYCDDFFVTDKTLADFYALDAKIDYSTTVFVLRATVEIVEASRYTTIQLIDGNGTTVSLYCSGAGQYSWLKEFAGQEITLEVAACNWNSKTFWRGCVLAVVHDDGSKTVNLLNFN